ncbi:DUF4345 domain-containing protein [Myxococcota bacterium]|nr:DUF4345 domain-containing protein [Myxococcota bacterium]
MTRKARILRVVLGALALSFAATSLIAFLSPDSLLGPVGISLDGPDALAEIRAAYGGFFLTTAALCAAGAAHNSMRGVALGYLTLLLAGFVAGRSLSWWLDGAATRPTSVTNYRLETIALLFMLALVWWHRKPDVPRVPSPGPGGVHGSQ